MTARKRTTLSVVHVTATPAGWGLGAAGIRAIHKAKGSRISATTRSSIRARARRNGPWQDCRRPPCRRLQFERLSSGYPPHHGQTKHRDNNPDRREYFATHSEVRSTGHVDLISTKTLGIQSYLSYNEIDDLYFGTTYYLRLGGDTLRPDPRCDAGVQRLFDRD
jgi:hypothetical protein